MMLCVSRQQSQAAPCPAPDQTEACPDPQEGLVAFPYAFSVPVSPIHPQSLASIIDSKIVKPPWNPRHSWTGMHGHPRQTRICIELATSTHSHPVRLSHCLLPLSSLALLESLHGDILSYCLEKYASRY